MKKTFAVVRVNTVGGRSELTGETRTYWISELEASPVGADGDIRLRTWEAPPWDPGAIVIVEFTKVAS